MEQQDIIYPGAARGESVDLLHGKEIADPYRWLEELDAEETRGWIEAQNRLTNDYLATIDSRANIIERLTELWDFEKFGVPVKRAGRYFYTRNDGLQNQSVLYWRESLEDEPKELLDPNTLSEDGTVALIDIAVNDDGRYLAYGLSASGSDWQTWHVRDIDTGQDLEDRIEWVKFSSASWTKDGQGFYYSRYDEPAEGVALAGTNYYQKLYYHRLGTPQSTDKLIYERPDQKEWGFAGSVTEDGRYLIIAVWWGTNRETAVFYQDLSAEDGQVIELLTGFDAGYWFIGNDGPRFYFLTDLDAPMSQVIAIDTDQPGRENWQTIIPETNDVLQSITLAGDHFVADYLHDAHSLLLVIDKSGRQVGESQLPGIGTVVEFKGKQSDTEAFYSYTSVNTPISIYRMDVATGDSEPFKQPALGFDPGDFITSQVFYLSKDGTRVPMFISHHKNVRPDAETPAYLYGYGGFNIPMTPMFSASILVWMEMGGLYAQASLRGGGEYGKTWHDAGRLSHKQNVFDDFIAAAEYLITNGYTSRPKLATGGGSNGGLLVGAILTQRPDLFGACLIRVGVLDMLRFHKFTIGWAWTSDYGSPDDADEFEALLAYSPYHNLEPGTAYPPTLIMTGDHDDRVFPAHSFKFAAALQAAQGGPAPTLIRIETKAGHGLGKPTAKLIDEAADGWAFLVKALNIIKEL